MGDEITIYAIEVVQNGLIQIDLRNEETGECFRTFCEPNRFFNMLGETMQNNFNQGGTH